MKSKQIQEFHVVEAAGSGSIKLSFSNTSIHPDIFHFFDNLSVGPIAKLGKKSGMNSRNKFWEELSAVHTPKYKHGSDLPEFLPRVSTELKKGNKIVIWSGPNSHEELMMFFLVDYFKEFRKQISLIRFPKRKIPPQGYPVYSVGQHPPEEIPNLLKLKKSLSEAEAKKFSTLWKTLQSENSGVRIRSPSGEYLSKSEDFFDDKLLEKISNKYINQHQSIGQVLLENPTNNPPIIFLLNRIQHLIKTKKLTATKVSPRRLEVKRNL